MKGKHVATPLTSNHTTAGRDQAQRTGSGPCTPSPWNTGLEPARALGSLWREGKWRRAAFSGDVSGGRNHAAPRASLDMYTSHPDLADTDLADTDPRQAGRRRSHNRRLSFNAFLSAARYAGPPRIHPLSGSLPTLQAIPP